MPNRRASTVSTRPGQKRTTRPKIRATMPRSARARQLAANVLNLCWYRPSVLMDASSLDRFLLFGSFCAGVRDRAVDRRVELRAEQHYRRGQIHVEEQANGRPKAPVGDAVVREGCQVEGEPDRGYCPQNHGKRCARYHRAKALPGVGNKTVDE